MISPHRAHCERDDAYTTTDTLGIATSWSECIPVVVPKGELAIEALIAAIALFPIPARRSPRRTACSAPMGRYGSSNTDGRPTPQGLGGRTIICGSAVRVAVS